MPNQSFKLFLYGLSGKMGKEITSLIEESSTFSLVGGNSSRTPSPLLPCNVAIDFSLPEALQKHLDEVLALQVPILIGTTGLSAEDEAAIKRASQTIPILKASNTSIGIALLSHLVKKAAQSLDESYDIEIFETHHRQKIDSPSGTAITLASAAAEGRNLDLAASLLPPDRKGLRPVGNIGYAVHRGGGVFGEHSVRFIGDEEVIELNHRSLSRRLFARGALQAARWLILQKPGLYEMRDMFAGNK